MTFSEATRYLFSRYPKATSPAELVAIEREINLAIDAILADVMAGTLTVQDARDRWDALCECGAVASADWLSLY